MVDTSAEKMFGVSLAGGVVGCGLLGTLYAKGILTLEESRNILDDALRAIGPYAQSPEGFQAMQIIGLLRGRFS
jgi:hypothetical protein